MTIPTARRVTVASGPQGFHGFPSTVEVQPVLRTEPNITNQHKDIPIRNTISDLLTTFFFIALADLKWDNLVILYDVANI